MQNVHKAGCLLIESAYSFTLYLKNLIPPYLKAVYSKSKLLDKVLPLLNEWKSVILKPKFVVYSDLSSPNSMVTGIRPTLLSEINGQFYQIKDIRDDTDCKMPKGVGRAPGLFF
ncbi:PREDICTED: uncharacterized protein LOC104780902 [Camelina sativa]|uniref:Uncharacterized protein LOC104780902 n=1 Tax=Camelina sativa TaxID=90675 RepID=A0ABM0YNU8_CAMSA|nr:PREDICTED: uncharacterized protein LOC104780902 [Camelina sativa]